MSFYEKFASAYKKLVPSPFTIPIRLTVLTIILAFIFTKPTETNTICYLIDFIGCWKSVLWNISEGGFYFVFRLMFMLVLGHNIAWSKPIFALITKLLSPCTTTAYTTFTITFSTILVSLVNWDIVY